MGTIWKKVAKYRGRCYKSVRNIIMKYNEDKILKEIGDYIKSTYGQHYAQVSKGTQVQDLLRDIGIDKDFCQT